MPPSKAPSLRQIVVDKCLSGEREMTSTEIMNAVNAYMLSHGLPIITAKNTIMDDIEIISMAWNVEITKTSRGKYVYYHYKDPLFSIHKPKIRTEDLEKINETIKALKKYVGLPQCAWVENVNAILHAYAYDNNDERPIVTFSHNPEYADNLKHFTPLYDFIKSKSAIVLKYKKFNSEEVTTRTLHPYQLKEYKSRWYLVGWCKEHPDHPSCYGLERIISFTKSDETYLENPGFDIDEYFRSMVGLTIYDGTVPQDVFIWVEKDEYPYIKTDPIHHSQKYVCDKDGGMIISLHLYVNTELEMQLMSYGKWIRVLAPPELRQTMKDNVKIMTGYYDE